MDRPSSKENLYRLRDDYCADRHDSTRDEDEEESEEKYDTVQTSNEDGRNQTFFQIIRFHD